MIRMLYSEVCARIVKLSRVHISPRKNKLTVIHQASKTHISARPRVARVSDPSRNRHIGKSACAAYVNALLRAYIRYGTRDLPSSVYISSTGKRVKSLAGRNKAVDIDYVRANANVITITRRQRRESKMERSTARGG